METQYPFSKLGSCMLWVGFITLLTSNLPCAAYVSRYNVHQTDRMVQRQNPNDIAGYYAAFPRSASRSRYYAKPSPANQRAVHAEHRKREWVWVPERNMALMVTPGARLPEKPYQRPFGPLGIGQQPQIFKTRMANGQEALTDYFGHRYKAPNVLGTLR